MSQYFETPWVYMKLVCKEHDGMCYEIQFGRKVHIVHNEKLVPLEQLHHGPKAL